MAWPEDDFCLPTRDGPDVGGAQERTMQAFVGGNAGIRTVEEVNPDGSITTLRTRNGWPTFETTQRRRVTDGGIPSDSVRGFVARIPGGIAVLFDPYTLAVLQSPYTPAVSAYTVQSFATTWNVPTGDTTHWLDTVLFDGTLIKVNGKTMPALGITASHGFQAIPHVINREDSGDQYGGAELNSYEKRVFAAGRYSVKSWGGGGVTSTLQPTTPRTDDQAMTLGQRCSSADDVAHLWQMYHTGTYWEGSGSEWYFSGASVQMLLAAAYLVKTDISAVSAAHTPAAFGSAATTTGTTDVARSIPEAIMLLVGHGELEDLSGGFAVPGGSVRVRYPWDGYWTAPVSAFEHTAYSRTTYSGSSTSTITVCDKIVDVSCTNTAVFDSNTAYIHYADQYTSTGLPGVQPSEVTIYTSGSTSPTTIHGVWGATDYGVPAASSSSFSWYSETSEVIFSASCLDGNLIEGRVYRRKESGNAMSVSQYNWAAFYLEYPRGGWGTGYGYNLTGQGMHLVPYFFHVYDPVLYAAEAALAQAVADSFVGEEVRSNLSDSTSYRDVQRYTFSTTSRPVPDRQEVTWSTKDYLLYDEHNGVAITIEGAFTGADTSASLTVNLRTKTRYHDTVQTLYTFTFAYSELVPLKQIGSTGKYAIPSPQIRSIFAPLYQEQGSFKGAHYVTLDEETAGATAFHGFNFLLMLRTYDDFSSVNDDNQTGTGVYFIPCNLLEMLYAFVFSQTYGTPPFGDRYQVTSSSRHSDVITNLFSVAFRIAIRNGVSSHWTDALGSGFVDVPTITLHRT